MAVAVVRYLPQDHVVVGSNPLRFWALKNILTSKDHVIEHVPCKGTKLLDLLKWRLCCAAWGKRLYALLKNKNKCTSYGAILST